MTGARVICLLLLARATSVGAEERCTTNVSVAGAPSAEARLGFLRTNLRRNARYMGIWHGSWSAIYVGLSAFQATELARGDHDQRIDHGFGLGASLLGLVVLQAMPQKALIDQPTLERILRRGTEPCEAVAEAERLLRREIDAEDFAAGPLVHTGNFIVNMALLLGLGAGFGHWDQAALAASVGVAVGEIQVWTQPRRARRTMARYRAGALAW
jgi:hypothetical protein